MTRLALALLLAASGCSYALDELCHDHDCGAELTPDVHPVTWGDAVYWWSEIYCGQYLEPCFGASAVHADDCRPWVEGLMCSDRDCASPWPTERDADLAQCWGDMRETCPAEKPASCQAAMEIRP